jgi:hypothetical protein
VSTIPPLPADATVPNLRAIATAHDVPVVYVLDEYMRQHPYQEPAGHGH